MNRRERLISAEHSGPSTTDCKNSLSRGGGDLPRRKFLALVGGALRFQPFYERLEGHAA